MKKIKLISIILALSLLMTIISMPVNAQEIIKQRDVREKAVILNEIAQIAMRENENIIYSQQKELLDFNNERYILIEFEPSGYMIYHPSSGGSVESSPTAPSPYKGLNDNLYYAGATYYYQLINGEYHHTVITEKINKEDEVTFRSASIELKSMLDTEKNEAVLDYIKTGSKQSYYTQNEIVPFASSGGLTTAQQNWFKKLNNFGYYEHGYGVCGYVALNMVIAFGDKFVNNGIMNDKYWDSTAKTGLKSWSSSLTKNLVLISPKNGTTSIHMKKVGDSYVRSNYNKGIYGNSWVAPMFTDLTIKISIDNYKVPVILFGYIDHGSGGKSSHAVVAYSYYDSFMKTNYVCHFGWSGYNNVTIRGVLGSILRYDWR